MSRVRSKGNERTELALVRLFREHGIKGWRRHQSGVFGTPDFVFRKERVAIFVDGCFWHNCPKHGEVPGTNKPFWKKKLARNLARDVLVNRTLRQNGWRVLRLWQHDIQGSKAENCVSKVLSALRVAR